MTRSEAIAIAIAFLLLGCADIDAWGFEVCGNNLVEPDAGEDCDLIVDPALGEDLQCGPPDGGSAQCRYVCDGAECPQGWTCGDDGLCRPPSGEFEVDDEPRIVVAARAIALRNVLGEDESELVARLDGDIVVFGSDPQEFRPGAQLSIAAARGELAFADIDDDERFDILAPAAARELDLSAAPRVHVLRDDGDRLATAVVPQRAADSLVAAVAGARISDAGAEVLLQVVRDDEEGVLAARVEPSNCVAAPADARVSLTADADAVVPAPAVSYGDGVAVVAIATVDSASVSIVELQRECGPDVCAPASAVGDPCATHLQARPSVTMPTVIAAPGCLLVDIDGAFDVDLLCHLAGDAFGVALSADTDFAAAEPGDAWLGGLDALPPSQSRACAPIARILAAADLDGDGDTDLVTPHGVFSRAPSGAYTRSHARTLGDGWGEAVLGDFDRDGQRDVVASVLQVADDCAPGRLELLEQTDGAFAARSLRGSALPSRLRVGDFDGSGIDDVAVTEPRADAVWATVLFGDVDRALEDTLSVGGFADITALTAVRAREGAEINEDLIGDLAIVSEGGEFVTLVTGTTTRALLSPLELAADNSDGNAPVVVLAGALVDRDPPEPQGDITPDVLTLRGEAAWLFRDEDVHHGDAPIVWSGNPFGIRVACSTWAVAPNLEAGGTMIAGFDGHAADIASADHGCDLAATPQLVVARHLGTRDEPVLQIAHAQAPAALRRPLTLAWLDLDDSGALDLLVHFEYDGELRRGTLAWAVDATSSSTPQLVPLVPDLDVWAATPIDADADARLEIAILGADGLRILDPGGEPGEPTFVVRDPVFDPPRVPVGDELVRLVAGDVDGDELGDLALLVGDAIYIYPALERE